MKLFEEPIIKVLEFAVEDVVTTSGESDGDPQLFGEDCF